MFLINEVFFENSSVDLSRAKGLFGYTIFYGFELPASFPPQTLIIVHMRGNTKYDDDDDDDDDDIHSTFSIKKVA